jgi:hypothetical protein
MATEQQKVLELVIYTLKDGTTEAQFTQAYDGLSEWIKRQPGFVSRDLLRGTADGRWIEVVWWTNQEDADAVAATSMTAPECAPFFEAIDMNAAQLLYGTPAGPTVVA